MGVDTEDVGTIAGCLGCGGIVLVKIAIIAAVVYIVLHFVLKYW